MLIILADIYNGVYNKNQQIFKNTKFDTYFFLFFFFFFLMLNIPTYGYKR